MNNEFRCSYITLSEVADIKMTARVPRPLYKFFRAAMAEEGTNPNKAVREFVQEKVKEHFPEEYKELSAYIETYYPVGKTPEVRRYWEDKILGKEIPKEEEEEKKNKAGA